MAQVTFEEEVSGDTSRDSAASSYTIDVGLRGGPSDLADGFYVVFLCIDSATTEATAVTLAGQSCTLKRRKQVAGSNPTLEAWYVDL